MLRLTVFLISLEFLLHVLSLPLAGKAAVDEAAGCPAIIQTPLRTIRCPRSGFISNSPGVTSIQRDETLKMDDPPSSSDYSVTGLTGKSGRGIRRRRVGTAWNLARITQDGPLVPGATGQGISDGSVDWTFSVKAAANDELLQLGI
ncbi:hypothetical protein B0H13DRAFT_1867818 [Mycena leptocephala]|nr:hypothetical protein B0H13DRAFT_1867818 [Mycena leptocephala]